MKRLVLFSIFSFTIFFNSTLLPNFSYGNDCQSYLHYKINRLIVINAVNLEPQQQKEVLTVFKKYDADSYTLLRKYNTEKTELDGLKQSKCSKKEITIQKKIVKSAEKQLKLHYKNVDKEILTVLTKPQKIKYRSVSKNFN